MNEASPGTRSLTLNPRPSVKNRCDASWSSEPTTTCPSLRGWTRLVRSMAGARPLGRSGRPGPLVGSCLAAASVIRGLTCTLTWSAEFGS